MLPSHESKSEDEFADFIGNSKPLIKKIDPKDMQIFLSQLATGDLNKVPIDCANIALQAFKNKLITREQISTLLERQSMYDFFKKEIKAFRITKDTDVSHFLSGYNARKYTTHGFDAEKAKIEDSAEFLKQLQKYPPSEQTGYTVEFDQKEFENHFSPFDYEKLSNFMNLANSFGLVKLENYNEKFRLTLLSMGAQNAQMRILFGEHAKQLFTRIGLFSVDVIEKGVQKGGRYTSLFYPGMKTDIHFHDMVAHIFFLSIHDKLHRAAISTIPNPVYNASLAAIEVVRKHTGIKMSKEIWNSIDLPTDLGDLSTDERNSKSMQVITKLFFILVTGFTYPENEPIGLFTPSPYVDTTWILLIDMVSNPQKWKNLNIDPAYLKEIDHYKELFNFVVNNIESIKDKPMVEQVALLKTRYLKIEIPEYKEMIFAKTKEERNYIQIMVDGKPLALSKNLYLMFKPFFDDASFTHDLLEGRTTLSDPLLIKLQFNPVILKLIYNKTLSLTELNLLSFDLVMELANGLDIQNLMLSYHKSPDILFPSPSDLAAPSSHPEIKPDTSKPG